VTQAALDITRSEKALGIATASRRSAAAAVDLAKAARKRSLAQAARWKSEAERMGRLVRERVLDAQSLDEVVSQYPARPRRRWR
jgi:hypothetical protein